MEEAEKRVKELHPGIQAVLQVIDGLYEMLGSRHEVIVHDLSQLEHSIVAVRGTITNRKPGGPPTNYLLQFLKKYGDEAPNRINYRSMTSDGRILRSTTIFIRDEDGHIIGSLCINQDLTDYIVASKLIQESLDFPQTEQENGEPEELFARDINEVMEAMVRSELELVQKPVAYMQKEDKLTIVQNLEEKGIFDVKGSVEYVAECLGVTHFTVYNYLKEIRGAKR